MSNKKIISLIDSIMEGNYKTSQSIVDSIVAEKTEARIAQATKKFLAKTQGK